MKSYKINELFYSLQGEGRETGRASLFIRFSGCNRACAFCDTSFDTFEALSLEEIVARVESLVPATALSSDSWQFVLTGGEPTLQVDYAFLDAIKSRFGTKRAIQIETNGTRLRKLSTVVIDGVRLTVSPKTVDDARDVLRFFTVDKARARYPLHKYANDEIKIVPSAFEEEQRDALLKEFAEKIPSEIALYLQPCDYGDAEKNAQENERCIEFIKDNPRWKLSLQTQKILNIR